MKFLPFIAGIFMFLGIEAVFYWPKFFYIFIFLGFGVIFFILKLIFRMERKQKRLMKNYFFYFIIFVFIFFLGVLSSLLFVKHSTLFYIISIISAIIFTDFLYTFYKNFKDIKNIILKNNEKEMRLSYENFFSTKIILFNLVTLFFSSSSIFGIIIFFRIPFWYFIPLIFLITVFFVFHALLIKGHGVALYDRRALVLGVLITQFFIILNYLPITFFTGGLLLTTFYGLSMLFIGRLFYECQHKRCRLYQILVGIIIIIISLLTL